MRAAFLLLLFLASSFARDDFGLFIPVEKQSKITMKEGIFSMQWKAHKVPITKVILRYDTEDQSILWIELHTSEFMDPGDYYLLRLKDRPDETSGLSMVRATPPAPKCCLGFSCKTSDIKFARQYLKTVAQAYDLPAGKVVDATL